MSEQSKAEIREEIRAILSAGRKLKWRTLRSVAKRMDREGGKPLVADVEYTRHEQIKAAMETGALRCDLGSGNSSGAPDMHTRLDIIDLWEFSVPAGAWWEWARQLCWRWSESLDQSFEDLAAFGAAPIIKAVSAPELEGVELEDILSGNWRRRPVQLPTIALEDAPPPQTPAVNVSDEERPRQAVRVDATKDRNSLLRDRAVELMAQMITAEKPFTKHSIADKIRGDLTVENAERLLEHFKDELKPKARKLAAERKAGAAV